MTSKGSQIVKNDTQKLPKGTTEVENDIQRVIVLLRGKEAAFLPYGTLMVPLWYPYGTLMVHFWCNFASKTTESPLDFHSVLIHFDSVLSRFLNFCLI